MGLVLKAEILSRMCHGSLDFSTVVHCATEAVTAASPIQNETAAHAVFTTLQRELPHTPLPVGFFTLPAQA